LSKVLRHVRPAPTVCVGERQLDHDRQSRAVAVLGRLFPAVAIVTDPGGARFIPVEEAFTMEDACRAAHEEEYRRGYREGQQAGLAQGLAKAEQVLSRFDAAIADAIEQRHRLLDEARREILDLVVQISRKVTFDAVTIDPESTLRLINGVIDTLLDRSRIRIKVHPGHLPIVEQSIAQFLGGSALIKELTIEPDPRVREGGCLIETPHGDVDARLESQFEVVREVLLAEEAGQ